MLALVTGCVNLAPDYERPVAVTPSGWPSVGNHPEPVAAPGVAELGWRDFFVNDHLRRTVATALAHNRNLRIAALDIEAARAQYHDTGAALFPTVDASGEASIARSNRAGEAGGTSRRATRKSLSVELGFASFELDFFGRLRNQKQAALDTLLSSAAARRSTQISLIGQVASDWLTLAADKERQAIARQTLANQQGNLDMVKARHRYGIASGSDIADAKSAVAAARVDVAGYTTAIARDRNALNLVAGTTVPAADLPGGQVPEHPVIEQLPAGIPSAVLQNRPDVIAVEYKLRGDTALIGAARAAFFPTISLTAATGFATAGLSSLFSGANRSWSFAPQINQPIFDGGSRTAQLDLAHIQRSIDTADYEQTIQTAFREIADALATRATIDTQIDAQQTRVAASAHAYKLALARYHAGTESYLDTLVEQRTLYNARLNEVGLRLARQINLITLYKTLGGGGLAASTKQAKPAAEQSHS
jgi:NodT family efflux transporter outer membrane factor (OMF) lipoprotein